MTAQDLVQQAFDRLATRSGFETRQNQVQLSLLLCDLIEQGATGLFEAPTGLGKSLAALVPAIANAIVNDKRTVIATYTNVLADQYWRKDLPLALSLFTEHVPTAFLIGRQRYACLMAMDEVMLNDSEPFVKEAELGIENEFRRLIRKPDREVTKLWQQVQVPPVCPAKACPAYDDCFYYKARKQLEKAKLISPRRIISTCTFHRITSIAQINKIHTLHHTAIFHIKAGDQTHFQHYRPPETRSSEPVV